MAIIWRVTTRWSGGAIGTGFTNMFFTGGVGTEQAAADATRAFFAGCYGGSGTDLPSGISLTFPSGVDLVEETTGVLTTTTSVTAPSSITGAGSGTYAAPAGACVSWLTGGVIDGRHVRGRTFVVPLLSSGFQSNGTIADALVTNISQAAAALIAAAPELTIWHRPASIAAGGGASFPAVAFRLNDKVAMLTSRR